MKDAALASPSPSHHRTPPSPAPPSTRPPALALALVGCGTPAPMDSAADAGAADDGGVTTTVKFESPQDDLTKVKYAPSFEPDRNNLVAQPWVEPATREQQDRVDVFSDHL